MTLIEIILIIVAWKRGWRWLVLAPSLVMLMATGWGLVEAKNQTRYDIEQYFTAVSGYDILVICALGVLSIVGNQNEKNARVTAANFWKIFWISTGVLLLSHFVITGNDHKTSDVVSQQGATNSQASPKAPDADPIELSTGQVAKVTLDKWVLNAGQSGETIASLYVYNGSDNSIGSIDFSVTRADGAQRVFRCYTYDVLNSPASLWTNNTAVFYVSLGNFIDPSSKVQGGIVKVYSGQSQPSVNGSNKDFAPLAGDQIGKIKVDKWSVGSAQTSGDSSAYINIYNGSDYSISCIDYSITRSDGTQHIFRCYTYDNLNSMVFLGPNSSGVFSVRLGAFLETSPNSNNGMIVKAYGSKK